MLWTGDTIQSDNLEVEFFYKTELDKLDRRKTFTVVCRCGNRKLMLARDCVRCHECGKGHDYTTFLKKKEDCYKLAVAEDGKTGRISQWTPKNESGQVKRITRAGVMEVAKESNTPRMKTQYFYCSSCRRSLPWTNEDKNKGIGPPIAEWERGEKCFDCIREITKTLIKN